MSNGKLERLRSSMETARGDYRDLLLVALEPNQFRVGMTSEFEASEEDLRLAKQQDEEQFDLWLKGKEVKVCEACTGVGILPEGRYEADPTSPSGLKIPLWVKCSFCEGTGNQVSQ